MELKRFQIFKWEETMKNREIEAKIILPKDAYQAMISSFDKKADFTQANYYFDTESGILKDNNISLRIRTYQDHAEQTMKVPDDNPVQTEFHEVIEITDPLSLAKANKLIDQSTKDGKIDFCGNIGHYLEENYAPYAHELQLLSWSKTRRILATGPHDCELTLDQTSYPDGYSDYELEIENTDPELIQLALVKLKEQFKLSNDSKMLNQNKIARAMMHRKQS